MRYASLCAAMLSLYCAQAQSLSGPDGVEAFDTPNDAGGSITVTWLSNASAAMYEIFLADSPAGPFHLAATVGADGSLMSDAPAIFGHDPGNSLSHFSHVVGFTPTGEDAATPLTDGNTYYVKVGVRAAPGVSRSAVPGPVPAYIASSAGA